MSFLDITIPDDEWTAIDADRHELVATLTINGRLFHLEAIEVAVSDDAQRVQYALGSDEHFGDLHNAFNAEGHYETITIAGREYALFGDINC